MPQWDQMANLLGDTIPGVGLGLSVARRMIEAHGGHIQVESKQGEGSIFRFCLPRRPEIND